MKNMFFIYRLIGVRAYKMLGLMKNINRLLHHAIYAKFIIPYFSHEVNAVIFLFGTIWRCKKTAMTDRNNINSKFLLLILLHPKDIIAAISFVISLCNLPVLFKYIAVSFNNSRAII